MTETGKGLALDALLPNGTDVWIGLLTTLPSDETGADYVEATGSNYDRVAHDAWVNVVEDGITYRRNNGAIEFAALDDALVDVLGWAIFDAASAGNLLAYGALRDVDGEPQTVDFANTDQPRFIDQELGVGID